jgi:5-methylthioadenosine/S-adenosylhomocysteine deaminase
VGKLDEIIDRIPAAQVEDYGQAAILPGFVNCHSHLEITAMRGALDDVENDFAAWLLKLNAIRASFSESDIRLSALAGLPKGRLPVSPVSAISGATVWRGSRH